MHTCCKTQGQMKVRNIYKVNSLYKEKCEYKPRIINWSTILYSARSRTGAHSVNELMAFKQATTAAECCFANSTFCRPAASLAAPKCFSRSCVKISSLNYCSNKQTD